MDKKQLIRASALAYRLIPEADTLFNDKSVSEEILGASLDYFMKNDKKFREDFRKLLTETKQRFQKEFDEL